MDFAEAAALLYAVPLDRFVSERTRLVAAARAAKDTPLVTEIGGLRKPSVTAWLVNQLSQQHPGQLTRLTQLGGRISSAQQEMAGDRLRETGRERSALLVELVSAAGALGRSAGVAVSPAVARELHDTFTAALASPEAAAAVTSGHLTRSLSYSGLGDVDLTTAVPDVGVSAASVGRKARAAPADGPDAAAAAEAGKARAEAAALAAAIAAAEVDVSAAAATLHASLEELKRIEEERRRDEDRLHELEQQAAGVREHLAGSVSTHHRAEQEVHDAERQVRESEVKLGRLSGRA